MKIISHRSNIDGPDPERENKPKCITEALKKEFDVEIDVFCVKEKLFLGHDEPKNEINRSFLMQKGLWIHCKNIEAVEMLFPYGLNIFCHKGDDFTITNQEYIWVYPGRKLTRHSIAVLPETIPGWNIDAAYGVCTDYPVKYKKLYEDSDTL
jgi:hypothetical protein